MPLNDAHFGGFFYVGDLMRLFEKPALTIEQHLEMMRERGLIVSDDEKFKHYLSNISYFRLSAYLRPFYKPNQTEPLFLDNTHFEDVLNLYIFDRELRLLLLDAIERIEISLRAQLANTLAEHYQPHGYLFENDIFNSNYDLAWLKNKLQVESRSQKAEQFLLDYRRNYPQAPAEPPIWMAMEILTFKEVSTLFSNLRQSCDTKRIEAHYGWKFPLLKSWFRSLSDLRNICAHHGRVWNREFGSCPEMPKKIPQDWVNVPEFVRVETNMNHAINPRRRLYLQVVVIESLMKVVCPESRWTNKLMDLFSQFPTVSRAHMGFPHDWADDSFWQI